MSRANVSGRRDGRDPRRDKSHRKPVQVALAIRV